MTARRGARLPLYLSLAYLALVVCASLAPFSGWRDQGFPPFAFLETSWARYFTWFDVVANFLAYIPLGFLSCSAWQHRLPHWAAAALACLLAITLSLGMETLQTYLPGRISSNLDLLSNSLGGITGAIAAAVWGQNFRDGSRLVAWRYEYLMHGHAADAALVALGLWLLSQFNPTGSLFAGGDLRDYYQPAFALHSPSLFAFGEAMVVAGNIVGIGLYFSVLLRRARAIGAAVLILLALLLKTFAIGTLAGAPAAWDWLTPGALAGLVAGALLLLPALRLAPTARIFGALGTLGAAVIAINLMPENPYFPAYLQELNLEQGHYMNFNKVMHWLSQAWPFIAMVCLLPLRKEWRHA